MVAVIPEEEARVSTEEEAPNVPLIKAEPVTSRATVGFTVEPILKLPAILFCALPLKLRP